MQAMNGIRVSSLVESSFFQRRTNQNSTIAARHQVHLGRADYMTQHVMPRAGDSQHLSLDWAGREAMSGETPRPRASAIHHAGRAVMSSVRTDAGDSAVGEKHVGDGGAGRNVH